MDSHPPRHRSHADDKHRASRSGVRIHKSNHATNSALLPKQIAYIIYQSGNSSQKKHRTSSIKNRGANQNIANQSTAKAKSENSANQSSANAKSENNPRTDAKNNTTSRSSYRRASGSGNQKSRMHVGTYFVCAVGEWFIGKQMDKLTKAEVDKAAGQTATCGVESILWERNSTKRTTRAIAMFSPIWGLRAGQSTTLTVSQGQEDTPASGTIQGPTLNRTLTSAQAKSHLHHARGTTVGALWQSINSRGRIITVGPIVARGDKVNERKAEFLRRLRISENDRSFRWYRQVDEVKTEYNVDSYRVISDFNDPIPTYSKLREPGEDKRARTYEATVTWKMQPLLENGNWGQKEDMFKTFPKGDAEGNGDLRLPSYEDNSFTFDFCESNQKITDIECGDSITRSVIDRDITEIKHVWMIVDTVSDLVGTLPVYGWRLVENKIGTERVVVHDEN